MMDKNLSTKKEERMIHERGESSPRREGIQISIPPRRRLQCFSAERAVDSP